MLTTVDTEKECRVCHEYYPLSHFIVRNQHTGRRDNRCRACTTEAERLRTAQRRESGETAISRGNYSPADPWADLACAILKQAVLDLNAGRGRGPITFFLSDWCDEVCALAGYDSEWIRERIGIG